MIRAHVFTDDGIISIPPGKIKKYLRNKKATVWVDLEQPTEQEYDLILKETFNFHPLSIEDCLKPMELPKIDVFDEHIFLVFHNVSSEAEKGYFKKSEVDFFLGTNYLVTAHLHKSKTIEYLMEKFTGKKISKKKNMKKSADFLLYEILDNFVDRYFPLLDWWDDDIEDIEVEIVRSSKQNIVLNKLMSIKREVLSMRRSIVPQRDVLGKMIKQDFPFIRSKTKVYFKDVYDHIMLVYTEIEIQRDLINSSFEAHMSVVSNQMTVISNRINEVMRKLTIIATIFMPLTFVTGLYGMNFDYLPGADHPMGFFVLVAIMLMISLSMLHFFRTKNWV